MNFSKVIFLYCLMLFCVKANAQVGVELDHVAGLTYCSFKESKKGNYSYCGDKIKTIAVSVSFSNSVAIYPGASSISINYIYEYISAYYKKLDVEIDEFKYDVNFLASTAWEEVPKKNYFYLHAKFFPLDNNNIICSLYFNRNGRSNIDSFLMKMSDHDYDESFKKELVHISNRIGREFILRKEK